MDTPALPNEVYAAFVTAGVVPGSKILTIDPSNALVRLLNIIYGIAVCLWVRNCFIA